MSAASGGANRCLESPSLPSKSSSWKKPFAYATIWHTCFVSSQPNTIKQPRKICK